MSDLDEQIKSLLSKDDDFICFWQGLCDSEKMNFIGRCKAIESVCGCNQDEILAKHNNAFNKTKKIFFKIPEISLDYSRTPGDWNSLIRDNESLALIYGQAYEEILIFLKKNRWHQRIKFYGNIKSSKSIDSKAKPIKLNSESIKENVMDIWDVVRFRLVSSDLDELIKLAICLWEHFFDRIVKSRNFYFMPKGITGSDPYRAIHLGVLGRFKGIFEVQLCTLNRETVSLLDHKFFFKGFSDEIEKARLNWLVDLGRKANIKDAENTKLRDRINLLFLGKHG